VEIANIMKDFYEPGYLSPRGLFLGPMKYMVIRGEPLLRIIQGQPGAVIRRGKKVTAQSPLVFVKKKRFRIVPYNNTKNIFREIDFQNQCSQSPLWKNFRIAKATACFILCWQPNLSSSDLFRGACSGVGLIVEPRAATG
jgi:hypothetical protein